MVPDECTRPARPLSAVTFPEWTRSWVSRSPRRRSATTWRRSASVGASAWPVPPPNGCAGRATGRSEEVTGGAHAGGSPTDTDPRSRRGRWTADRARHPAAAARRPAVAAVPGDVPHPRRGDRRGLRLGAALPLPTAVPVGEGLAYALRAAHRTQRGPADLGAPLCRRGARRRLRPGARLRHRLRCCLDRHLAVRQRSDASAACALAIPRGAGVMTALGGSFLDSRRVSVQPGSGVVARHPGLLLVMPAITDRAAAAADRLLADLEQPIG